MEAAAAAAAALFDEISALLNASVRFLDQSVSFQAEEQKLQEVTTAVESVFNQLPGKVKHLNSPLFSAGLCWSSSILRM